MKRGGQTLSEDLLEQYEVGVGLPSTDFRKAADLFSTVNELESLSNLLIVTKL